ncbi:hypothetical protein L3Q82_009256 [Scortum barcoo]|uniref:Uncharacterized protein n=1 Tax=Scortum barcoo TaxID=214431 RepID=A0ACB8WGC2_9TELE|nr:hypothetical protein L3Q82_009256 [Scortum barcoo]
MSTCISNSVFVSCLCSVMVDQLTSVGSPSLGWSWVFAIGVLGISCLGIYAGYSEKILALKIFAGFMGVGMVIMLIFGIIVAVTRNKLRENFDTIATEIAKPFIDDPSSRAMLEEIQQTAQCCGVASSSDWGNSIPQSCACRSSGYGAFGSYGGSGCKSRPSVGFGTTGPDTIYKEACSMILLMWVDIVFKIAMGLCFGFAVTALLGLLVSLLMIHQVKRHDGAGATSIAMKGY